MKSHVYVCGIVLGLFSFNSYAQFTFRLEPIDPQYKTSAPPQETFNGGGVGIEYRLVQRDAQNNEIPFQVNNCKFTFTIENGTHYGSGNTTVSLNEFTRIAVQWNNSKDPASLKVRYERKNTNVTCVLTNGVEERVLPVNIRYIGEANVVQFNGSPMNAFTNIINCGTTPVTFSTASIETANPVNGPVYYDWSVPSGWSINSGQGTNSINVTPSMNTDGNVKFIARRTDQGTITKGKQHTIGRNTPTVPVINSTDFIACKNENITATASNVTSYVWGTTGGSYIASSSGNSATVGGTSDGTVFVAAYSSACNMTSANSLPINVYASAPTASGISIKDDFGQNAPSNMNCGYGLTLHATHPKAKSYVWSFSGNIGSAYKTDYGNGVLYFNSYVNDCYGLTVNASNCFGTASDGITICINDCSSGFASYSVYPNPARETVNIQFDKSDKALPDKVELIEEVSQKVVIDKIASKNQDNNMVLDVRSLPRGRYVLRVTQKNDKQKPQSSHRIVLE